MSELRTENLTISFGGLTATNDVNFNIKSGEIVGIIGPNGAGKTTLINLIAGIYYPTSGKIWLDDRDISQIPAHERSALGIGRTFQLIHPLEGLTVLQNVMTGFLFAQKMGLKQAREEARKLCKTLELTGLDRATGEINILETKKMEIAKALATNPKVMFLDEVMAGLNSTETLEAIDIVKQIATERNLAVGVVEHVMGVITKLTHSVIVLDTGRIIASGPYKEVAQNERVKSAYLGGGA
ncbi:ABC transporter ATP-binding protein [Spirochaeta isovalerica]|uniref:Branched-chain amino acid transport system ATP-binding protein n=1 Tax=Spirochaeta isovalerica TaxID=150 RepID=A0A841RGL6_9SPIO|nr:ABC transporter ATP-binding protein [Spirochaeta isovalerica]MBB6482531.1 branched-chain amino acid transport system ATP-binding protein [Spirochaeta isovalerica]